MFDHFKDIGDGIKIEYMNVLHTSNHFLRVSFFVTIHSTKGRMS